MLLKVGLLNFKIKNSKTLLSHRCSQDVTNEQTCKV